MFSRIVYDSDVDSIPSWEYIICFICIETYFDEEKFILVFFEIIKFVSLSINVVTKLHDVFFNICLSIGECVAVTSTC